MGLSKSHTGLKTIERKILQNTLIKRVFEGAASPPAINEIYLVGGYLRDLIHRGIQARDMDFVVRADVRKFVNSIDAQLGGTVVELKKEHMIRLVLKHGMTLDFSRLKTDISEDLTSRDFTFNAIAWSPSGGLIDPCNGMEDIRRGVVRGISKENFKADPLRLLRAYRFSSEFCMEIDKGTRRNIRGLARSIRLPARERITLEFIKLLNGKYAIEALKTALSDGILTGIISLFYKELGRNIKIVSKIDEILKKIPKKMHNLLCSTEALPLGLTYPGLLRLEGILIGSNARENLLSLSARLNKRVNIINSLMIEFNKLKTHKISSEKTYDLFYKAQEALIDLLILTDNIEALEDAKRFLKIVNAGLLGGKEIMKLTGMKEGPGLGHVINELRRRQFASTIRTKKEAFAFLKSLQ